MTCGRDHSAGRTIVYRPVVDRLEMYNFLVHRTIFSDLVG